MLSLLISCKGLPPDFFAGAFFCFLELGGVFESRDASPTDSMSEGGPSSSSSLSGLGRFFEAVFVAFRVVWTSFFAGALADFGAVVFFGPGFALAFYGIVVSLDAIDSTNALLEIGIGVRRKTHNRNGLKVIRVTIIIEGRVFHHGIIHDCRPHPRVQGWRERVNTTRWRLGVIAVPKCAWKNVKNRKWLCLVSWELTRERVVVVEGTVQRDVLFLVVVVYQGSRIIKISFWAMPNSARQLVNAVWAWRGSNRFYLKNIRLTLTPH